MSVSATIIDWDGENVPDELRQLPAGRYQVLSIGDIDEDEMSPEEEAAVLEGLADLEAGRVMPLEEALRALRFRSPA